MSYQNGQRLQVQHQCPEGHDIKIKNHVKQANNRAKQQDKHNRPQYHPQVLMILPPKSANTKSAHLHINKKAHQQRVSLSPK